LNAKEITNLFDTVTGTCVKEIANIVNDLFIIFGAVPFGTRHYFPRLKVEYGRPSTFVYVFSLAPA